MASWVPASFWYVLLRGTLVTILLFLRFDIYVQTKLRIMIQALHAGAQTLLYMLLLGIKILRLYLIDNGPTWNSSVSGLGSSISAG